MNTSELIEKLSKTQMALANSNPTKSTFEEGKGSEHTCIHCGASLHPNQPPSRQGHSEDCIWLEAVFATGDYP